MAAVRILIVDDSEVIRRGLRALLSRREDWEVCGEAVDGQDAIDKARELKPDVVLLDVTMPRLSGLEAAPLILQESPGSEILIISQHHPSDFGPRALQAGAKGFVSKSALGELFSSIDEIQQERRLRAGAAEAAEAAASAVSNLPAAEFALHQILDALPAAIYTTDAEGRLTYFNPATVAFSGRTPALGSDHWCVTLRMYRPDGSALPHDQCPMAVALKQGRAIYGEEAIAERPDGTRIRFAAYPTPFRDAKGRVAGGVNMLVDITERNQAEEALRSSEARFRTVFEQTTGGIAQTDLSGRFVLVNDRYCEIVGRSREELLGLRKQDITHPEDWSRSEARFRALAEGRGPDFVVEKRYVRPDGSYVWAKNQVSGVRDSDGTVRSLLAAVTEITDHKRAEALLAGQKRVLEMLARGAILTDVLTGLIEVIEGQEKGFLGCILIRQPQSDRFYLAAAPSLPESYLHVLRHSFLSPPYLGPYGMAANRRETVLCCDIASDERWSKEWRDLAVSYGLRTCYSTPILASEGKVLGSFCLYRRDLHDPRPQSMRLVETATRLAGIAIERRHSDSELEELVKGRTEQLVQRNAEVLAQAEELRTLSAHLLKAQDDERRRIARELHDSAGQLLTVLGMELEKLAQSAACSTPQLASSIAESQLMIRQLTEEIRTTSYLLHPPLLDEIGLNGALRWYAEGLEKRSGIAVKLELGEDVGRLPEDLELAIFRIVQESLTNIHRHSGSKSAGILLARDSEELTLKIDDDGCGIPAEQLRKLQGSGSGVGLHGMRERARQLGGSFNIGSKGHGTSISVRFPLAAAAARLTSSAVKSASTRDGIDRVQIAPEESQRTVPRAS